MTILFRKIIYLNFLISNNYKLIDPSQLTMVDVNGVNAYEGQELAYTGEAITSTTKKTNW